MKCAVHLVYYGWVSVGGGEYVYVGDIADDSDERAIMEQFYAKGMGWA